MLKQDRVRKTNGNKIKACYCTFLKSLHNFLFLSVRFTFKSNLFSIKRLLGLYPIWNCKEMMLVYCSFCFSSGSDACNQPSWDITRLLDIPLSSKTAFDCVWWKEHCGIFLSQNVLNMQFLRGAVHLRSYYPTWF